MQLTGEAVRQQLLQLQREGWVDARIARPADRNRTGRPATSYALTEKGDHLFPKAYDTLSVTLLDAVSDELGADAAVDVLRRLYDDRVTASERPLRDLPLAERVEALRGLYAEGDPFMEVETTTDGFRLIERNCPFLKTAMRRPALCSVTVNTLTKLLGVRVVRDEKFQLGDGRCVFRVHAGEPVRQWQFRLESEMSEIER